MFLYGHWIKLPIATRTAIAIAFGIPKTGSTHVANNEVISDGYKIFDVENALNLDALQRYLNSDETDFVILWNLLVAKTEGKEEEITTITTTAPISGGTETVVIIPIKKKRGRPKKT